VATGSTVIKLKRTTTASTIPTTVDLEDGEVAVNVTDKKIFVRNGSDIVEVANYNDTTGSGDLTNISSNLVPSTDTSFSVGTIEKAFTDIFYSNNVKQQVDIFTTSGGLATATAHFTFRPNISKTYFTEVYTNSGGISTPALTAPTAFDDNNPAYRF
jgi:hypothetical protein